MRIGKNKENADEKVDRDLAALTKRYKLKIIKTKFFDLKNYSDLTYLVVSPYGTFLINAEDYQGLAEVKVIGGLLRHANFQLFVGEEDRTNLIEDIRARVDIAQSLLNASGRTTIPVKGVLFLPKASWPLFGKDTKIGGILLRGEELSTLFFSDSPYSQEEVDATYEVLLKGLANRD